MVSPYTAYGVSIVTANCLEKINLIVAWDSETGLIFIFKIMKKGTIIKGIRVIGIFESKDHSYYRIKFVKVNDLSYIYPASFIELKNLKIPTRKEKEEYKKFLLKNGYSYYRGKVTKEL